MVNKDKLTEALDTDVTIIHIQTYQQNLHLWKMVECVWSPSLQKELDATSGHMFSVKHFALYDTDFIHAQCLAKYM